MTISFQEAVDAALVVNYGEVNQAVVKGLNKIKIPGYERTIMTVEEFRNEFSRQFAGGGKQGSMTLSGNLVIGDTTGQDILKNMLYNKTKAINMRAYLNTTHFVTVDLANDSISAMQVVKVLPGEADKNGIFSISIEIIFNGRFATFWKHYTDGVTPAMAFVQGSGTNDTITGVPASTGLASGDTLIVEGSTSNDGQYLISEVSGTTVTISQEGALTSEAAIEGTAIHGGWM